MRSGYKWVVAPLALALVLGSVCDDASAQERGRRPGFAPGGFGQFGGGGMLLLNRQVQEELGLTEEQREKIQTISREGREGVDFRGLRELPEEQRRERMEQFRAQQEERQKKIDEVLTDQQRERLQGIQLQVAGTRGLLNREISEKINLAPEQRAEIQAALEEEREKLAAARPEFRREGADREQLREQFTAFQAKSQEIRKETDEKINEILTSEQRAQVEDLKGKKVDIDLRSGFGERGGFRGRGERPQGERPRGEGGRPRGEGARPQGERPRGEGGRPRGEGERPRGEGERRRPQ